MGVDGHLNSQQNREHQLEQFANAQLARLIAKNGNTFEGISLQGK